MIVVYFAQQKYDAVHRENSEKKVQPFYDKIDTAFDDCKTLKKGLSKYRISEDDKHFDVWDAKLERLEK